MTRTSVAILSLLCSSALAAAVPQQHAADSQIFKPSRTAVKPDAPLPPVLSIKKLFVPPDQRSERSSVKVGTVGGELPVRRSHAGDSWLTCGMSVFMADPNVDPKALKKHSSKGFPIQRIEPKTCK